MSFSTSRSVNNSPLCSINYYNFSTKLNPASLNNSNCSFAHCKKRLPKKPSFKYIKHFLNCTLHHIEVHRSIECYQSPMWDQEKILDSEYLHITTEKQGSDLTQFRQARKMRQSGKQNTVTITTTRPWTQCPVTSPLRTSWLHLHHLAASQLQVGLVTFFQHLNLGGSWPPYLWGRGSWLWDRGVVKRTRRTHVWGSMVEVVVHSWWKAGTGNIWHEIHHPAATHICNTHTHTYQHGVREWPEIQTWHSDYGKRDAWTADTTWHGK